MLKEQTKLVLSQSEGDLYLLGDRKLLVCSAKAVPLYTRMMSKFLFYFVSICRSEIVLLTIWIGVFEHTVKYT